MVDRMVAVVGFEGAELLDIACVTSAFAITSQVESIAVDTHYKVFLLTLGGRPIRCQSGLVVQADAALDKYTYPIDTLVVSGGVGHDRAAADQRLVAHVRRLAHQSRRVASVCTGAMVLAATGLLDGHRVTTHWTFAHKLATRHPQLTVDARPVFIHEGNVWTSAGITCGLDMTLALIENDHGASVAREVARAMVAYLQRPGNQSQISMFVAAPSPSHNTVRRVVDYITEHLADDLTQEALAQVAGVSPRHLLRLFQDDLGQPPGDYVRRARIEAATQLLVSTRLPLEAIARRCGYQSADTLGQTFTAHTGLAPSAYRRRMTSATA